MPEVTWWVAREAILNALVHRDYFLRQSVMVELHPDRVMVVSPGGFFGGVDPRNILHHPPVRRNAFRPPRRTRRKPWPAFGQRATLNPWVAGKEQAIDWQPEWGRAWAR